MQPNPVDVDRIRVYVSQVVWTYAKSMPQTPHEYTLRQAMPKLDGEFVFFVQFIREHGYKGKFRKTTYVYYNLDGWKYWTMGSPVNQTILINREKLPE